MGGIYVSFQDQKSQDSELNIKAMATQIGLNLAIAIAVMVGFCLLRPRNILIYAPKSKYSDESARPPTLSQQWYSWIKPLWTVRDDYLLPRVGYDAVLFIKFLRLIRTLLWIMTIIGLGALVPVNIVATMNTSVWPPSPGIEFLSISGINYANGKLVTNPNLLWYWAPFAATWFFSLVLIFALFWFTNQYRRLRERYFRTQTDDNAKTILISHLPKSIRTDKDMEDWAQLLIQLGFSYKECLLGRVNSKLTDLYEEHQLAVRHLEIALASYLNDGKKMKQRPTMRIGGFLGIGGQKVDVIEYYTKQVRDIEQEINTLRRGHSRGNGKTRSHDTKDDQPGHFGWVSFDKIKQAQGAISALNSMHKHQQHSDDSLIDARPSPDPHDLIWANLGLEPAARRIKRWAGRTVYWVFVFAWMLPIGALSATSNIVNIIRFLPNANDFISSHQPLMGIIQSWLSPIVMALFFMLLPLLFRFISKQQGYRTHTTVDGKVYLKLYIFFIFNNLLVFTLVNLFVGIFGQVRALIQDGSLPPGSDNLEQYIVQVAQNISDVSTFWINYVCTHGLGLTMELCQLVPLVTLLIKKWLTRPSPRQLHEYSQPPPFDYAQAYSILVFFFTIALLYSVMAPLILPFTLLYFSIASMVYKYTLMYIYVTKMESGGKMWPVLFYSFGFGMILFHIIMIIMLHLKGGNLQAYCLIPLPFLTLAFLWFSRKRLSDLDIIKDEHTWLEYGVPAALQPSPSSSPFDDQPARRPQLETAQVKVSSLKNRFRDPAVFHKLARPTVHDDVKHLLPMVYHQPQQVHSTPAYMSRAGDICLETKVVSTSNSHHLHISDDIGIDFCALNEEELNDDGLLDFDDLSDDDTMDEKDNALAKTGFNNNERPWCAFDERVQVEEQDNPFADAADAYHGQAQRGDYHARRPSDSSSVDWQPMERKGIISQLVDLYDGLPSELSLMDPPPHPASPTSTLPRRSRRHSAPSLHVMFAVPLPPPSSDDNDFPVNELHRAHTTRIAPPARQDSMAALLRRPSQPRLPNRSRAAQHLPQVEASTPYSPSTRRRRHSLAASRNLERQGNWIRHMDQWRQSRIEQPPHSLTRSTTLQPGAAGQHPHLLQRSNTEFIRTSSQMPYNIHADPDDHQRVRQTLTYLHDDPPNL
ncbi:DUF221-domain-containing protein [Hesseltinella vesiculosa]|uniref:DUF221-domain-containing protein n=1 Tax=Hesseltinella vesiculosa TaxID=101127 RepID=A0A1X2G4L7_9FUNG|nr:DUF221-domain-containing protein [Hesseltinella vesiculosa]